jgi:hypothetical protein
LTSKLLIAASPERSSRFVSGSMRRACSGTTFAQTAIFIARRTLTTRPRHDPAA